MAGPKSQIRDSEVAYYLYGYPVPQPDYLDVDKILDHFPRPNVRWFRKKPIYSQILHKDVVGDINISSIVSEKKQEYSVESIVNSQGTNSKRFNDITIHQKHRSVIAKHMDASLVHLIDPSEDADDSSSEDASSKK